MILRMRAVSWLALLLITSEVRSGYYSKCYNDTDTVSGYTLCLSTNTDLTATWSNAQTACINNGSILIDVTSPNVTNILNSFRADTASSLSTVGNWIGVNSPATLSTEFQWINGAPQATEFEVKNQLTSATRRFAVIQHDSTNNNQPIYSARLHTDTEAYICQFTGTVVCADGLIRNSSCYMKYNESLSWFNASNSCLQKGGSLAIFADLGKPYNDTNLTSWLNLTATSPSYWIGLILPWWQRNGGGNIQYSNWGNGKPETPSSQQQQQQCVLIENNQNKWTSFDCTNQQRFVCQTIQPLSTPYTTTTTSSTQSTMYAPSSTSSTATGSERSNKSTVQLNPTSTAPVGLIVGVVVGVGGAIIIAAIVLVVWFCVIKRKRDTRRRESVMPLGSPRAENTFKSPTTSTTLTEVTTTTTTSPPNEIIYADIVKAPQSPDHRRDDQPDVVQSQNLIYAELSPPMK